MDAQQDIIRYNSSLTITDYAICEYLCGKITAQLHNSASKIWHGHPVWFIDGNPIVGYSKEKRGIRLMFWSGQSFDDDSLPVRGGKFQDASIFYKDLQDIHEPSLDIWLQKAQEIQWDYKNIVKRKGVLLRLK